MIPWEGKTLIGTTDTKYTGSLDEVLVLDEATSSLDSQTEYEIQKCLGKLMQGRTNIIIAHRLSTIKHADTIVVMEDNQRSEIGKRFPKQYMRKKIISLNIPDIYYFNQQGLINILKSKVDELF